MKRNREDKIRKEKHRLRMREYRERKRQSESETARTLRLEKDRDRKREERCQEKSVPNESLQEFNREYKRNERDNDDLSGNGTRLAGSRKEIRLQPGENDITEAFLPEQQSDRCVSHGRRQTEIQVNSAENNTVSTQGSSKCLCLIESREDKEMRLNNDVKSKSNKSSKCRTKRKNRRHLPTFKSSFEELKDVENLNFSKVESCPESAVMLFHLNQGPMLTDVSNERLSMDEKQELIDDYQSSQEPLSPIEACGVCGMKDVVSSYMSLSDLKILCLDDEQMRTWLEEKGQPSIMVPTSSSEDVWIPIDLWRLRSIYESGNHGVFLLHPELVEKQESNGSEKVCVCVDCKSQIDLGKVPDLSVANGIDFGCYSRLGLTYPNLIEQAVIARIRLYRKIIKIKVKSRNKITKTNSSTQQALQGHFIAFGHDAPDRVCEVIDPARICESIVFEFLAESQEKVDHLAKVTFGLEQFRVRSFVLYQWLVVLSHVNSFYHGMELPCFLSLKELEDRFTERLEKTAMMHDFISYTEANIGSDVAGVRTESDFVSEDDLKKCLNSDQLQASFVTPGSASGRDVSEFVNEIDTIFKNDVPGLNDCPSNSGHNIDCGLQASSGRSSNAKNEYTESNEILSGAFPFIFMYGIAHGKQRPMNVREMHHVLLQYNNIASMSKELLFYLFDQHQRHANNKHMAWKIKGNPTAFKKYASMVNSIDFQRNLKAAIQNPKSKIAKLVLKQTIPILHSVGHMSPTGGLSTAFFVKHVYGMAQYFGPGSCFFTIAPDDVNNPRSLRLSQNFVTNGEYPALIPEDDYERYIEMLENNGEVVNSGNIIFPMGYHDRIQLSVGNPVSIAREYNCLIKNVLNILIGVEECHQTRRTEFYLQKRKGVFGHIAGAIGVHETQARGALHMHIVLFGGLKPDLLEKAACCEDLCRSVTVALDEMYCGKVEAKYHVRNLIAIHSNDRRLHSGKCAIRAVRSCSGNEIDRVAQEFICGNTANIHSHCFTCHKRPNGKFQCRMDYPQPVRDTTTPIEILSCEQNFQVFNYTEGAGNINPIQTEKQGPIKGIDRRNILYEISRPEFEDDILPILLNEDQESLRMEIYCNLKRAVDDESQWNQILSVLEEKEVLELKYIYEAVRTSLKCRNGYVVEHNRIITALTGSNTNAKILGNTVQSNAALFYLSNYLSKNKAELEHVLSSMGKAFDHVRSEMGRSTADDADSNKRIVQHWLVRVLNSLDKCVQVSDTQAAAMIFGLKTEISSHHFQLVGIHEAKSLVASTRAKDNEILTIGEVMDTIEIQNLQTEDENDIDFLTDVSNRYDFWTNDESSGCHTSGNENWGPGKVYRIKDSTTGREVSEHVCYSEHYLYRGEFLKNLNRIEYACLISCEKKKEINVSKRVGRRSTPQNQFGKGFKLEATHAQQLRSKQKIPVHTGRLPIIPDFEAISDLKKGDRCIAKKLADYWAGYYLVAFRAETNDFDDDHRDLSLKYDYDAFIDWINEMEQSARPIDQFRLQSMYKTMFSLKTLNETKVILKKFRSRAVIPWTDNVAQQGKEYWDKMNLSTMSERADGFVNVVDENVFSSREILNAQEVMSYSNDLMTQIKYVFKSDVNIVESAKYVTSNHRIEIVENFDNTDLWRMDKIVRDGMVNCIDPEIDLGMSQVSSRRICNEKLNKMRRQIDQGMWSCSQKKILHRVVNLLKQILMNRGRPFTDQQPVVLLCTGGPGTGKTTVNNTIKDYAHELGNIKVIKLAFMGVAAIQAQGQTLLKFMHSKNKSLEDESSTSYSDLDDAKLHMLRETLGFQNNQRKAVIIIIDEVSMITTHHLALLDSRLKQAVGNNVPFGGMSVLLFGDFSQLPPVGGQSLCMSVMQKTEYDLDLVRDNQNKRLNLHPGDETIHGIRHGTSTRTESRRKTIQLKSNNGLIEKNRKGAELFLKAEWWPLLEQQRSIDPVHTRNLQHLGNGHPISDQILSVYDFLCPEDNIDPEWRFAPIIVATNRERMDINEGQIVRFATETNTYVIRWPVSVDKWINGPSNLPDRHQLQQNDPVFWQYFCIGAPAYINTIINIDMEIANGTSVTMHSICCIDTDQNNYIQRMKEMLPIGSVISLKEPPLCVNVAMTKDQFNNKSPLKGMSLVTGNTVFPLTRKHKGLQDNRLYWVRSIRNSIKLTKVKISNIFPVEIGFAMTVHKSQGRTMNKLILALSPRTVNSHLTEMSYEGIFVALSRVKRASDLRLILPWGTDKSKLLNFLRKLTPKSETIEFFHGYLRNPKQWNEEDAYLKRLDHVKKARCNK